MCVVTTLDYYISFTKKWRADKHTKLFLSTIEPHQPVVKSTVSGWIKDVLSASGIDTSIFTAHSTRSASTSKAKAMGLSVEDILKRGHWSGQSTWQKHYHKIIESEAGSFQQKIGLASALN